MNEAARELSYDEIAIGDSASFSAVVTEKLIADFARLSGDENPLHTDKAYGQTTPFGGRIAHGMIAGALFSRLIGMHIPGKYALYLSQTLRFREPMHIDEKIIIQGKVLHKTDATRIIAIETAAKDTSGKKIFVDGEALVKVLR